MHILHESNNACSIFIATITGNIAPRDREVAMPIDRYAKIAPDDLDALGLTERPG